MNIVSDMYIAATAPPPAKVESPKPSDGDNSFQQTLEEKVKSTGETKKQQTEKEKETDPLAGAGAVAAPSTPVVVLPDAMTLISQAPLAKVGAELSQVNQAGLQTQDAVATEATLGQLVQTQVNDVQPVETPKSEVQTLEMNVNKIPVTPIETTNVKKTAETQAEPEAADIKSSLEVSQMAASSTKIEAVIAKPVDEKQVLTNQSQVASDSKVQMQAFANALSSVNKKPDVQSTPVMQQVIDGIKSMVDSGQTTLRLQIHPENMGRIEMKFVSGSGGVQVFITSEKSSTNNLLETNIAQLQQSLQNAGVKLGGMNLSQQQGNQGNFSAWQAPTPAAPYNFGSLSTWEDPVETRQWGMAGSLSALDTRI